MSGQVASEGDGTRERRSKAKIKPQPTVFFEILAEKDVKVRSKKIAAASRASIHSLDDGIDGLNSGDKCADIISDPSSSLVYNLPSFLRQLAGNIYVDESMLSRTRHLGEGGFAVVEKAELGDKDGGSATVAIKTLKPGVIEDDEDLKELIQEANLLRKLQHKYIVHFRGIGCFCTDSVSSMRNSVFFAEEFMGGGTLKGIIASQMKKKFQRKYRMEDAWRWCHQVAEALDYLHHCNPAVVHRDLKPENVLLTDDSFSKADAKVADFGLHKRINRVARQLHQPSFRRRRVATEPEGRDSQRNVSNMIRSISGQPRITKKQQTHDVLPENARPIMLASAESVDSQQHGGSQVLKEIDRKGSWKRRKSILRRKRTSASVKSVSQNLGNIGSVAESCVSGMVGSLMYMAPEVVRGEKYNEKVDVFAFGLILYELFRGELTIVRVLSDVKSTADMEAKLHNYANRVSKGYREKIPEHWDPLIHSLLADCWAQDPQSRPTMAQIIVRLEEIESSGAIEELDAYMKHQSKGQQRGCRCGCIIS